MECRGWCKRRGSLRGSINRTRISIYSKVLLFRFVIYTYVMAEGEREQQQQGSAGTQGPSGQQSDDVTGVEPNKLMAALSYLGILVLIPLFVSRKDPFVVFHAKQGLVVLIGYVIAGIATSILWLAIIGNLLWLVLMIVSIIGLIQALQGKRWRIPGIAQIADTFKI